MFVLLPLGFALAAYARPRVAARTTFGLIAGAGIVCMAAGSVAAGFALVAIGMATFALAERAARSSLLSPPAGR